MGQIGDAVKGYEHWFVLLSLVCVLVLTYYLVYVPMYEGFSSDWNNGGTYGVGSHIGHQGLRDDTGFSNPSMQYDANGNKMQGFSSRRKSGMSVGGFEPPVFWNAGSYAAVANAQAQGISQEQLDDGSAFDGTPSDGFSAYKPKGYAYDGFQSGPQVPVANVVYGGQPLLPNYQ